MNEKRSKGLLPDRTEDHDRRRHGQSNRDRVDRGSTRHNNRNDRNHDRDRNRSKESDKLKSSRSRSRYVFIYL